MVVCPRSVSRAGALILTRLDIKLKRLGRSILTASLQPPTHTTPTTPPNKVNNHFHQWLAPSRLLVNRPVARLRGSSSLPSLPLLASSHPYVFSLCFWRVGWFLTLFTGSWWGEEASQVPPRYCCSARDPPVPEVDGAPDQEAALPATGP